MALITTRAHRIRGIVTSVPPRRFDNLEDSTAFERGEVEKVVRMAGVRARYLAGDTICSSDLCVAAAKKLLAELKWEPETVDALLFVTQTPDYFLPSTCCLAHGQLGLSDRCAAFDIGLGCSGYPYGLSTAASMLQSPGVKRVLLLHGETPTRFSDQSDRAVALLFGDAGSATAIEASGPEVADQWHFALHTDSAGWRDLLIEAGGFRDRFSANRRQHFVEMNGPNVFNFTIKRVPALIDDTLTAAGLTRDQLDYIIFHQSNQFIMRHLFKKAQLPNGKMPMILDRFGSAGGPSVPLTITQGQLNRPQDRALKLLLLGYGVGLSWGSAMIELPPDAILDHVVMDAPSPVQLPTAS
jgi:3-oxoacyl-[acyl-carrier-protein] synthase-3